ncbi:MAG: TonB-dependent receptor [Hyphomonadaceae bacterium]|nr:TonB-dependent receptor [Hyphomonadaceae bacterium]
MSAGEKSFKFALLAGATVVSLAAPAFAQDSTDEIVITAQRREQNVQDVPITLQVVTADTIQSLAADDIGDLSAFVPGLSVSNSSPTQARYSIRGVSTSDFGVGTDPAVGVYVDGVYAARSGAGLLAFSDVARIEVLKGPQGTLFGRNSAAGAVSITTNQPSDEFEARLSLRAGEYDKRRAEAMINVPLTDALALRVNALVNQRDGWLTDGATGTDYDREDNWAFRGALRWDASADTSATLAYTHDNVDQDARPAIGIVDRTLPSFPFPDDPATYVSPFDDVIYNDAIDNHETRSLDEATLTITHDFGGVDFTSITSGRYFETENREDEDGTNRIELYFDTNNVEKNRSWYQEVRFAGQSERFDWIAGVSYYDEHARQRSDTVTTTDGLNTLAANVFGLPAVAVAQSLLDAAIVDSSLFGHLWGEDMINEGEYSAAAVFGDVIWHATDRLNITVGARYTHDEKTFQWFNASRSAPELDAVLADPAVASNIGFFLPLFQADYIFDLAPYTAAGISCDGGVIVQEGVVCELSDSWNDVSPRFVADYRLSDDVMAFFSFAQGYKAGGFNSVQPGSRFENEDVDNYELGIKSDFDNGVRFNASVFHYTYTGKQSIELTDTGAVQQYITTTSDDEAWGADVQVDWAPSAAFNVFANIQYIDATYADFITTTGVDLSGQATGEPYWSLAGGVNYSRDLPDNRGTIDVSVVHSYRGESRCNESTSANGSCIANAVFDPGEAQNRTDFRGYWTSPSSRYELGVYVNNMFNERYVTGVNNITAGTFGTPFVSVNEPLMWGVDFTLTY